MPLIYLGSVNAASDATMATVTNQVGSLFRDALDELITAVLAASPAVVAAAAEAAADAVAGELASKDIVLRTDLGAPVVKPSTRWAKVWLSKSRNVLAGITGDGTFRAPRAVQVGPRPMPSAVEAIYARASLSRAGRIGEDAYLRDGTKPQWVLDRWAARMGVSSAETVATAIAIKGDSMSSRTRAGAGLSWGDALAAELGLSAYIPCVSGEGVTDALVRTGVPIKVTGLTQIPAGTGEVVLEASQVNDGAAGHRDGSSSPGVGVFNVTVLGVPMRFQRVGIAGGGYTVGQWRVNRVTAGTAIPIPPGFPVWAYTEEGARNRSAVTFFADGRNGMSLAQFIDTTDRTIAWLGHGNWWIVPPVLRTAAEVTGSGKAFIDGQKARYGAGRVLDWQPLMSSEAALAWAGITPTSQDLADITDGVVPTSFRYDSDSHLNDLGLQVWAHILHQLIS